MKKLFIIIIFLVFFNILSFMLGFLGVFPVTVEGGSYGDLDTSDSDTPASEEFVKDISGADFSDVMGIIFFGTNTESVIITFVLLGGAALLAYICHSPAPFVVAMIANVFIKTYQHSMNIMYQFSVNSYLMLIGTVGMILLFISVLV